MSLLKHENNENSKQRNLNILQFTISVGKVKGADENFRKFLIKLNLLKKDYSNDVHVEITRNYGETAADKVGELLLHLGMRLQISGDACNGMAWWTSRIFSVLTFALTLLAIAGCTLTELRFFAWFW
jgi:hypothetical protein